jgi:hypothetical protein
MFRQRLLGSLEVEEIGDILRGLGEALADESGSAQDGEDAEGIIEIERFFAEGVFDGSQGAGEESLGGDGGGIGLGIEAEIEFCDEMGVGGSPAIEGGAIDAEFACGLGDGDAADEQFEGLGAEGFDGARGRAPCFWRRAFGRIANHCLR